MKKMYLICIAYLFVGILIFLPINALSPTNVKGEVKSIEQARNKQEEYYQDAKVLSTVKNADRYVDFCFSDEGKLLIVSYNHSVAWGIDRFSFDFFSSQRMEVVYELDLEYFLQNGSADWADVGITTGVLAHDYTPIFWTLLDPSFEITGENITACPFEYEKKQYMLYIKNDSMT